MRTPWLALLVSFFAFGCDRGMDRIVRDSEGRKLSVRCDGDGRCSFEQQSGPRRSDDRNALALDVPGRLVAICDVRPGSGADSPGDCRPLLCADDGECPLLPGGAKSHCLDGHCSDAARPFSTADAVMLCLAGTGFGRSSPKQVERYALGLNCGSPCELPAPCKR
jgi:hypothetical protein